MTDPKTYAGSVLIFLNPFKETPKKFSEKKMKQYSNSRKDSTPPHIYSIAESTILDMNRTFKNQILIFSGESGSGKSENLKEILKYLSYTTRDNYYKNILEAFTILESFGNTSTKFNSNATYFANSIEIDYSFMKVIGANFNCILFNSEKVFGTTGRNFHIFYQLLTSEEYRKKYKLKEVKDYKNLPNDFNTLNDANLFNQLLKSLNILSIPTDKLFSTVSLILHLGNITNDEKEYEILEELYGIKKEQLENLNIHQEIQLLYFNLFDYLVKQINSKLAPKQNVKNSLTLVDYPGFQVEEEITFGNFTINHFNDVMNNILNQYQFKKEQDTYILERIDWKPTEFELSKPRMKSQTKLIENIQNLEEDQMKIDHLFKSINYKNIKNWKDLSNIKEGFYKEFSTSLNIFDKIQKFSDSIFSLTSCTKTQKVVCMIPNNLGKSEVFHNKLVLNQVEKHNLQPIIKLTRKGFLDHHNPDSFYKRYFMLGNIEHLAEEDEMNAKCKIILRSCGLASGKNYKIGKNTIFLKYGQIYELEDLRAQRIMELIVTLQAFTRGHYTRKKTQKLKEEKEEKDFEKQLDSMPKMKKMRSATMTGASIQSMQRLQKKESFYDLFNKEAKTTDDWSPQLTKKPSVKTPTASPKETPKVEDQEKRTNSELLLLNNNLRKENQMVRNENENLSIEMKQMKEKLFILEEENQNYKNQITKKVEKILLLQKRVKELEDSLEKTKNQEQSVLKKTMSIQKPKEQQIEKKDQIENQEIIEQQVEKQEIIEPKIEKQEIIEEKIETEKIETEKIEPKQEILPEEPKLIPNLDIIENKEIKQEDNSQSENELKQNIPESPIQITEEKSNIETTEEKSNIEIPISLIPKEIHEEEKIKIIQRKRSIHEELKKEIISHPRESASKKERKKKIETFKNILKESNEEQPQSFEELENLSIEKLFQRIENNENLEKNLNTLLVSK